MFVALDDPDLMLRSYCAETIRAALLNARDSGIEYANLLRLVTRIAGRWQYFGEGADTERTLLPRAVVDSLIRGGDAGMSQQTAFATAMRLVISDAMPGGILIGSTPTSCLPPQLRKTLAARGMFRFLSGDPETSIPVVRFETWSGIDDVSQWWPRSRAALIGRMADVADSHLDGFEARQFTAGAPAWRPFKPRDLRDNEFLVARQRIPHAGARPGVIRQSYYLLRSHSGVVERAAVSREESRLLQIALATNAGAPLTLRVRRSEQYARFALWTFPLAMSRRFDALAESRESSGPTALRTFRSDVARLIEAAAEKIGIQVLDETR
jgi:hypothetical protein